MIMGPKRAGEYYDQRLAEAEDGYEDLQRRYNSLCQQIYDQGKFTENDYNQGRFTEACLLNWELQEMCRELDNRRTWFCISREEFVKVYMWRNDPDEPRGPEPPQPTDSGPSFPRIFGETGDVPGLGDVMTMRAYQRWVNEGPPAKRVA